MTQKRPAASRCPPPRGFDPAGYVIEAEFARKEPNFVLGAKPRGRLRKAGIRYERQGIEYLQEQYPLQLVAGPWFVFRAKHKPDSLRWCQPDALLVDIPQGIITIVEFKWKHTSAAWWQTRHLYEPVVRALFPGDLWRFKVLEIVRWFDPSTRFPEPYTVVGCPEEVSINDFGVLIWSRGREFGVGRTRIREAEARG